MHPIMKDGIFKSIDNSNQRFRTKKHEKQETLNSETEVTRTPLGGQNNKTVISQERNVEHLEGEKNLKQLKGFKNLSLEISPNLNALTSTYKDDYDKKVMGATVSDIVSEELVKHKDDKWSSLKLSSKTIKTLLGSGFAFPSPVQYQSIPDVLSGSDVLVRAKNGSGKTLSFIIPVLEKVDESKPRLQAIILVPIRELALQISKVLKALYHGRDIVCIPLIGGSDLVDDIVRLSSGVHILIGTPGRVLDVMDKKLFEVDANPLIIFDEADKLLDEIYYEAVSEFLKFLPSKKQMCLYSATFPKSIKSFVDMNLKNYKLIKVSEDTVLNHVGQFFVKITTQTKLPCLKSILLSLDIKQCIIYCNNVNNTEMLAKAITETEFSAYFIHSRMSQNERNTVFHNFSRNKCKFLISTDITTRGIDIQGINVVINFEMPMSSESYLHRIGRAGRFGTKGCCISLIFQNEVSTLEGYSKVAGSTIEPICHESFKAYCKSK